ncbi:hypothetical protein, partial [Geothrix fermentans]|uniref:hypothetical protein n=1 Tax=Geothrix fermentans TaxID=44676 RepID=UPI001B7F9E5D
PSALSVRPKGGLCALCVPLFWLRLADNQVTGFKSTKQVPFPLVSDPVNPAFHPVNPVSDFSSDQPRR